jgi:glycosyltransferase involved in cell wall biosynthesis
MAPVRMNDPFASFIVPTYNRRRWIGECLDAIDRQTCRNFEVIVIDDCSSDGTVEWLRSKPEYNFVRVCSQEKNGGASVARNMGVRLSKGELITFIDSDDLLEPEHLETAMAAFRQYPNLGLFCCDAIVIGPDGERLNGGRTWHTINGEIKRYPVNSGLRSLTDIFLFSNSFPGFTLRREIFERVGYFDQDIFPLDDYDLALRVAGAGHQVYYCHRPLARYRVHETNSSGAGNGIKVGKEKLRCLRLALERNPEIRALGSRVSRRLSEVKLELAITQIRAGKIGAGMKSAMGAFLGSPALTIEALRLGKRKAQRIIGAV